MPASKPAPPLPECVFTLVVDKINAEDQQPLLQTRTLGDYARVLEDREIPILARPRKQDGKFAPLERFGTRTEFFREVDFRIFYTSAPADPPRDIRLDILGIEKLVLGLGRHKGQSLFRMSWADQTVTGRGSHFSTHIESFTEEGVAIRASVDLTFASTIPHRFEEHN